MKEKILTTLKKIEQEQQVTILYAVESGSRAWGFASEDSDYDVRFIYARNPEWYLSIEEKSDVLTFPIDEHLDLSGWDTKKTLQLFAKNNPSILEWLASPIIYQEQGEFIQKLRLISKEIFSSQKMIYHYLHMAKGNYRGYLREEEVKPKKYLYVLRPILASLYLMENNGYPPVAFTELMAECELEKDIRFLIEDILEKKISGELSHTTKAYGKLNQFIEEKLVFLEEYVQTLPKPSKLQTEILDELFRQTLIKDEIE